MTPPMTTARSTCDVEACAESWSFRVDVVVWEGMGDEVVVAEDVVTEVELGKVDGALDVATVFVGWAACDEVAVILYPESVKPSAPQPARYSFRSCWALAIESPFSAWQA